MQASISNKRFLSLIFIVKFLLMAKQNNGASQKSKSKKSSMLDAKKSVHFEVDLNEDEDGLQSAASSKGSDGGKDEDDEEEEEESGEDDEFIDVLDVLDGKGEAYIDDDDETSSKKDKIKETRGRNDKFLRDTEEGLERKESEEEREEISEEESEEEEDESEEEQQISGDEMDADLNALDSLGNFVSQLETSVKRKAEEEKEEIVPQASKKKRKLLKDVTEAGVESEFGARAAGMYRQLISFQSPHHP